MSQLVAGGIAEPGSDLGAGKRIDHVCYFSDERAEAIEPRFLYECGRPKPSRLKRCWFVKRWVNRQFTMSTGVPAGTSRSWARSTL